MNTITNEEVETLLANDERFTDLQKDWITLLITTELPQCRERLFDGNGYCCIGLAAKFILNATIKMEEVVQGSKVYFLDGDFSNLIRFAEMNLHSGTGHSSTKAYDVRDGHYKPSLATLNDRGTAFREIGVLLATSPETYFTNFTPPIKG